MSLRMRINLIVTTLIVLFTLLTAQIIVSDMRRSIREEMEAGGKITLQLLTGVLEGASLGQDGRHPNAVLAQFLESLGRVRAHDIQLFAADGTLLYQSPPSTYKIGRHAPQLFYEMVAPRLNEMSLDTGEGRVVVRSDDTRSVLDAWDDLMQLLWLLAGLLVVINLVVFLLVGRSLRPTQKILAGMSKMQRGELQTRLPPFALHDFDEIGRTFNSMADALEHSHAENQRLALVAQQSSDAIVIHDLQGNISFWNPAAERLFGYAAQEILGRSATLLTPAGAEAEVEANLSAIRDRRLVQNLETQRLARDGARIDVLLSAAPLIDPVSDQVIGEIVSMRDITAQKHAQQVEADLEQNRRLTRLIQTHLEEERRSIARELHDELGQCVTAIRTIGAAIANRARDDMPDIKASAQTIVQVGGHIYDVVHGIIRQLRPSALDNLGLREALEELRDSWSERYPDLIVRMDLHGNLDDLGETVNITIYRLLQECITNVVRHAAASRADIHVERAGKELEVTVRDNGKGLGERNAVDSARFGLMGLRERVEGLNGRFSIESRPGEGVIVRAFIPLHPVAAATADAGIG